MSAYSENYRLIKWSAPKSEPKRQREATGSGPTYMPDIKEFVSPIDGSLISSRKQLRDHERAHGVRQVGTDLKPEDYARNGRKEDVARSERGLSEAFGKAVQYLEQAKGIRLPSD